MSLTEHRRTLKPFVILTPTFILVSFPCLWFLVPSNATESRPQQLRILCLTLANVSGCTSQLNTDQFPRLNTPNKTVPSAAKCQTFQSHLTGWLCIRQEAAQRRNTHSFYFHCFLSFLRDEMQPDTHQQTQDGYPIISTWLLFITFLVRLGNMKDRIWFVAFSSAGVYMSVTTWQEMDNHVMAETAKRAEILHCNWKLFDNLLNTLYFSEAELRFYILKLSLFC